MTIAEIIRARDIAREAYYAALQGKSYSVNMGGTSRAVTRNDVNILRSEWERWEQRLVQAQNNARGIKTRFITPAGE